MLEDEAEIRDNSYKSAQPYGIYDQNFKRMKQKAPFYATSPTSSGFPPACATLFKPASLKVRKPPRALTINDQVHLTSDEEVQPPGG